MTVFLCRTAQSGNGAVAAVASVRSVPQEVAEEQLGGGVKPASRKAASGQLTDADVMQAISDAGELGYRRSVHCVGLPAVLRMAARHSMHRPFAPVPMCHSRDSSISGAHERPGVMS